ncbi:hypothetical protein KV557_24415 [Kitasatospora aureofaciens]|uniref:hypothetical protein n=1 Tax=Kitasatospora aureofaciens TaxID=1894 RepID=UPI001C491116|nr:hypothetical protein [Kitasatospora aureofaciens]MBV6700210.1 hypothetical protein [Kitasatospora aureofaciens]
MGWILVVVLVVAGAVVWLMLRYPGGWRYAFSAEYAEQRRDLDAARGKLRVLQREAGRERDMARSDVEAAERAHHDRVNQAQAHLAWLRAPGRGVLRSSLGDSLRLYDHALEVTVDGRTVEYPLHEVSVRDEYSRKAGHVYVALPTGRQQMVTVSLEETPEAEAEVRKFVVEVFNAAADAKVSKAERQALVPQAEAELRNAIADTDDQEQARRRLAEVVARQKSDARIPGARRELDAARDRWQQLTGRRPE